MMTMVMIITMTMVMDIFVLITFPRNLTVQTKGEFNFTLQHHAKNPFSLTLIDNASLVNLRQLHRYVLIYIEKRPLQKKG